MNAFAHATGHAARRTACATLIVLGFSIPVSTAFDNILLAVFLVAWVLAGRFRETVHALRTNPMALMAAAWFLVHVVSALYSMGDPADVTRALGKAATFLLVPLGIAVLADPRDRSRALYAFMAAIGLTVALSWLRWGGVVPSDAPLLKSTMTSTSVVFKYHLTQNLLLAIGALVFAIAAGRARARGTRVLLWTLCALSILNVVLIGDGRTGQVVLAVIVVYYAVWRWGPRGIPVGAALVLAIGAAGYLIPESTLHQRSVRALSEARDWRADAAGAGTTSIGQRLEFYSESARVLRQRPWAGAGTGGFPAAYAQHVQGTGLAPTRNPHNEYLLKGVELGVLGLVLICALWWVWWRTAARLGTPEYTAIARGLVLVYAAASLATTTLSDHAEGLLFVWAGAILFSALQPRSVHASMQLAASPAARAATRSP